MSLSPGDNIGRYTVDAVLGAGAMAQVFSVRHDTLETRHALKILMGGSPEVQQRLIREGKVQASLRHPNAVAVTDVFDIDGAPVLLMELIEGPDLEEWLEDYKPNLEEALAVFGGVLAGMRSAHNKEIIHRDMKPGNVLLHIQDQDLIPKVADFGLAKAADPGGMKKTQAGVTMGTPAYMAPEQIRDASTADGRADIFALGCILYELVTGKQCFDGPDIFSIFSKIATSEYTDPLELVDDLPDEVVAAIHGALKTDRDERFADCDAMAVALFGSSTNFPTSIDMAGPGGECASTIWAAKEAEVARKSEEARAERAVAAAAAEALAASLPPEPDVSEEPASQDGTLDNPAFFNESTLPPSVRNNGLPLAMIGAGLFLIFGVMAAAVGTAVVISGNNAEGVTQAAAADAAADQKAEDEAKAKADKEKRERADTASPDVKAKDGDDGEGAGDVEEVAVSTEPVKPPPTAAKASPPPQEKKVAATTVAPKATPPLPAGGTAEAAPPSEPSGPPAGKFSVSGDAAYAVLRANGKTFSSSQDVPVGNYEIFAKFGDSEVPAGSARIAEGVTISVKCVSVMKRCNVR